MIICKHNLFCQMIKVQFRPSKCLQNEQRYFCASIEYVKQWSAISEGILEDFIFNCERKTFENTNEKWRNKQDES